MRHTNDINRIADAYIAGHTGMGAGIDGWYPVRVHSGKQGKQLHKTVKINPGVHAHVPGPSASSSKSIVIATETAASVAAVTVVGGEVWLCWDCGSDKV